jgi:hypothetical protein
MILRVPCLLILVLMSSVDVLGQDDTVTLRRLRDLVVVREGIDRVERTLYEWDAKTTLREGDQYEQGGSAHTVLLMPTPDPDQPELRGTTVVELNAPARVLIEEVRSGGDVLRLPWVTLARIKVGPRPLTLFLPGQVVIDAVETEIHIQLEPGRLHIRNSGGAPLHLSNALAAEPGGGGLRQVTVARGEEIRMPLFLAPEGLEGPGTARWGALSIDYDADADLASLGWRLVVTGGDAPAWVSLGGVRTRARPGGRLVVSNHGRFGRALEADSDASPTPSPVEEVPDEPLPDDGQLPDGVEPVEDEPGPEVETEEQG